MTIKKFRYFEIINEEFVGGLIKGSLGKLFNLFAEPFKDLKDDIKKMFDPNDMGTIKDIILTNVNQAIDKAQKEIPNIKDEGAISEIMIKMIDQLVQLAGNIGNDVVQGLGKEKANPFTNAAKAVILGNKESKWPGLVGSLDPNNPVSLKFNGGIKINYKFNRAAYEKSLGDVASKGGDILKNKKITAQKFLDNLQKDIINYVNRELSDEELTKIYDKSKDQKFELNKMNYDKLKEFFDKKISVIYLLKDKSFNDYNDKKSPNEQLDVVGIKPIHQLKGEDSKESVIFLDKDGRPTIKKSYDQIIGPSEVGDVQNKVKKSLSEIKDDNEKMGQVAKFAQFIKDEKNKNKIEQIKNILNDKL